VPSIIVAIVSSLSGKSLNSEADHAADKVNDS
jgi:hypothetical protein